MKCAIVTGHTGFIGRQVVARLIENNWRVLGIGRRAQPALQWDGVAYHAWNGNQLDLLPANWQETAFTWIDLAWDMRRQPQFVSHAEHLLRFATMLDSFSHRGLAAVVGVGSGEEYGQRGGIIQEDQPPEGRLNAYGWGKRAACEMLRCWNNLNGTPACWLRPFLVYGPGQSGNMVVPYLLRQTMHGGVAQLSDGEQQRDFVYVDDVAEALVAAAESPQPQFEIFNIGTGIATPVRSVLSRIGEALGISDRVQFGAISRRPGEPDVQIADVKKAKQKLNWQARTNWIAGVQKLVESALEGRKWAA